MLGALVVVVVTVTLEQFHAAVFLPDSFRVLKDFTVSVELSQRVDLLHPRRVETPLSVFYSTTHVCVFFLLLRGRKKKTK